MPFRRPLLLPLAAVLAAGALLPVSGALVLARGAPAQKAPAKKQNGKWRLEHRLQNPLLYLSRQGPALVDPLPLLNDPVLQKLLGQAAPGGFAGGGSGAVLRDLARLLSCESDDLELALTRMVQAVKGATETPSLIFRCQLTAAGAGKVGNVLRGGLAEPTHKLDGQQVFRLRGSPNNRQDPAGSGNLVVSNDPSALQQAISSKTKAAGPVLSQKPRYQKLRKQIDVPAGAVMLYANWEPDKRKPGRGLSHMLERELGLPFRWSGLGDTDRLLLVVRPRRRGGAGFVTSVLLGQRPPRRPRHWPPHWPDPGPDGWLQAVKPAKPQQLLGGLHPGALGSLAVAVDPKKLLGPAGRGRMLQLQRWIFGHASKVGLDVRSQIIRRLGKTGGAQVLLLPGGGVRPRVAYSFQARTAKQASDLIADLKKVLANSRRVRSRQLASGKEVLEITSPPRFGRRRWFGGRDHALLAAVGDAVYFTFDQGTMEQVVRMSRSKGRQTRSQREAMVRRYLKRLGAWDEKVAGIFAADLGPVASRVLGHDKNNDRNNDRNKGRPKVQSRLFGQHAGYFTVEQGLIRLEVFSPR
ncbi:MAG: hypothetical protein ACYST0_05495 [Planctomycetota bacterium]